MQPTMRANDLEVVGAPRRIGRATALIAERLVLAVDRLQEVPESGRLAPEGDNPAIRPALRRGDYEMMEAALTVLTTQ